MTDTRTPCTREDAVAALRSAAFTIDDPESQNHGRTLIHVFAGPFGADWDLDDAVKFIEEDAAEVWWDDDVFRHQLKATNAEGRVRSFDVRRPEPSAPEHLSVQTTDRGFDHLPPIPSEYGGEVSVYESSAASGPHIWLRATAPVDLSRPDGPTVEAPMRLTAENAWRLAEQLQHLVRNHYQGDATPERAEA